VAFVRGCSKINHDSVDEEHNSWNSVETQSYKEPWLEHIIKSFVLEPQITIFHDDFPKENTP
jgi:hypothetical protein